MAPRTHKADLDRIKKLFEQRRPSYSIEEAAALLGIASRRIRHHFNEGTVMPLHLQGEVRIGWAEVVLLGLIHRWSLQLITEAVRGGSAEAILPPLVQATPGTIVLPRYLWTVLELLAAERQRTQRRAWNAGDVVEEAVRCFFIEGDWEHLEAQAPGVRAALEWPANDVDDVTT